ncbi:MAG: hypothetical protein PUC50_05490 [Bacteroidales bacterium]|nr:hypothetical protein [Bacteroidales bacterium]
MKISYLFLFIITILAVACGGYPDYTIEPSKCGMVRITHNGKSITLKKDTAWYVDIDGNYLFYADRGKIDALLNTLRDINIQGISNHDPKKDFQYTVEVFNQSERLIKTLKFNAIPSSANMVGSVDGSQCYVVGIPGLNISPTINFNPDPSYWKNLALLEIYAQNVSQISITHFQDPKQSFSISLNIDTFVVKDFENKPLAIPQTNVRQWLGALGTFCAAEYCTTPILPDSLKISQITVKTKSGETQAAAFYKRTQPDGTPDYNRMWFITPDGATGTAKYFDYDILLIGVDKLR